MLCVLILFGAYPWFGSSTSCLTSREKIYTNRLKCLNNDSYCGDWTGKVFKPVGCEFREVTTEQANKCMKGKTLACIGDSIMAAMCNGLAMVLYGVDESDPEADIDYIHTINLGLASCSGCEHGKRLDENYVGNFPLYPSMSMKEFHDYDWQIQTYFLYFDGETVPIQIKNMLNNNFTFHLTNFSKSIYDNEIDSKDVVHRKHDFAIINNAAHVVSTFNSTPGRYGRDYVDRVVQEWIDIREQVATPSVWTSTNGNCNEILSPSYASKNQAEAMEDANHIAHKELGARGLPYFDFDLVLRTPNRCEISKDGLHIKSWAELTRARILLNYLCDDDWNWVGDINAFIDVSQT